VPAPGRAGSAVGTGVTIPAVAASAAGLDVAGHTAQIADLIAAVDEGREPLVTGADARATLELVCAVYQSAREGRPVTLPVHQRQSGLSAR
jgi:predicted dehydrogenase